LAQAHSSSAEMVQCFSGFRAALQGCFAPSRDAAVAPQVGKPAWHVELKGGEGTPVTGTPDCGSPLLAPSESPSVEVEAVPEQSPAAAEAAPRSDILVFDLPASPIACFLDQGEIVHLLYTCHAGHAAYTCDGKLLCPWLVYNKDTKADAEDLVKRIALQHVLAARFVGTRLCMDTLKEQLKTQRLTQIERFSAKGCHIHAYDIHMLTQIASAGKLQLLNLEKNMMGDDVVEKLVSAVLVKDTAESLDTLNIRFNKVGNKGARALAELVHHPSLTIMNLKINAIGLDGATALARMLETNTTLKVLNLRNQTPRLPPTVATPFANALRVNSTLTRLKLRRNRLDCAGVAELAQALRTGSAAKSLLELDVQQNYVKAEGGAALAMMLRENTTLEVVYAGGNSFERGDVLGLLAEQQVFELDSRLELAIVDDF